MNLHTDDVAVVTGAASGIGLALVRAFCARGLAVVMSDVRSERLDVAARDLRAEVTAVVADVSRGTMSIAWRSGLPRYWGKVNAVLGQGEYGMVRSRHGDGHSMSGCSVWCTESAPSWLRWSNVDGVTS